MNQQGCIEIIIGPMFSGKTTELMRRLMRYTSIGSKILYINHSLDKSRTEGSFSTHNPLFNGYTSAISTIFTDKLPNSDEIIKFDIIAIDEAQFFENLGECIIYADKFHKRVILSGLSGDHTRNKFGNILDLIPKADSVNFLSAMCLKCAEGKIICEATFTYKCGGDNSIIEVGASDKYIPVCRFHYLELHK